MIFRWDQGPELRTPKFGSATGITVFEDEL